MLIPIIARPKITPLVWAWRFSALILLISFCKLNMVKGVKGLENERRFLGRR